MSFEIVDAKIREALETGAAHAKLRALEAANEFDETLERRLFGRAAIGMCVDAYANGKPDRRVHVPSDFGHVKRATFIDFRTKRLFAAVSTALDTQYGVVVSKPATASDYQEAATTVMALRQQTRSAKIGPLDTHVLDPKELAVTARGQNSWLMVSDFTVPGTPYFKDVMKALGAKTTPTTPEDL